MIPRKQSQKSKTVINTCVSFIKQELKKMTEIPEKHDSLTWNTQSFVRKVKQFVRKFYITLLPNYDVEKFLDFIVCNVLLKIVLFY